MSIRLYTRRSLLVTEGPQPPSASTQLRPMHKPPLASAGIYWQGRTHLAEPPLEGARLPSGSTTIAPWQVVGPCTLKIPALKINMKVWEGETSTSMSKGLGHYSSTSAWDGNVGACGHNRGTKYAIGSIKDLKQGDTITYTTIHGTRTYARDFL